MNTEVLDKKTMLPQLLKDDNHEIVTNDKENASDGNNSDKKSISSRIDIEDTLNLEPAQQNHQGDKEEKDILEVQEEQEEEDPNWEIISKHEPAQTDVPIFLSARDHRDEAYARFGAALDECHASLKHSVDELLSTAASIHHVHSEKLDELEIAIKDHFVGNEAKRDAMHRKLQESATAAQGLFSQLLMRVSQPLADTSAEIISQRNRHPQGHGKRVNGIVEVANKRKKNDSSALSQY